MGIDSEKKMGTEPKKGGFIERKFSDLQSVSQATRPLYPMTLPSGPKPDRPSTELDPFCLNQVDGILPMVAPKSALELEDPHVSGITSLHPEIWRKIYPKFVQQLCSSVC